MNKKQRKQRAAAIRRNQKLARKAHRQGSGQANRDADSTPADATQATEAETRVEAAREEVAAPAVDVTGEGARATRGRPIESPQGRRISDSRARAMLEDAAEFLSELVNMTRDALKQVAPARVAAAMEVVEARGSVDNGAHSTGSRQGTPQQQPRRAPDPLVTMIKQGISASNLLKRIISTLYPKLAKIEVPALV